jgi:hypothetical protein
LALISGLVQRVIAQTKARILGGDKHYHDKVLSLFEPQTEAIRKGKASKPTEFGQLVKIQEAENQFVVDYQVYEQRPDDRTLAIPSLEAHQRIFGRPPYLLAAEVGFGPVPTSPPPPMLASKECVYLRLESPQPNNARSNINAGFGAAKSCAPDARAASAS